MNRKGESLPVAALMGCLGLVAFPFFLLVEVVLDLWRWLRGSGNLPMD